MRKRVRKMTTVMLTTIIILSSLVFSSVSVEATQDRTYNFYTNYNLTGNPVDDIVSVAMAQQNRTKASMGYTEAWCADFVGDCADLAGLSYAIPRAGYCGTLWDNIINSGGYEVSSPQKGDIIFYYCTASYCPNSGKPWVHVGIMTSSSSSIEGNSGGKVTAKSKITYTDTNGHTYGHAGTNSVTVKYLRPKYKDEPVKNAWLNINRSELFTGESINFSFGAENSNGSFTIGIDRYGTRVDTINVQGNSYDYTFYQDGDYSAYVTAHGGGTYCDSNRVYFRVTRRWYDNLESADLGYSFLARIEHKASGISFADINGNVQGMVPSTDSSQIWAFTRLSNGAYKIRNVASNGFLDVQGSGPDDNTNVITHWNDTGGSNQQFFIYFLDNGYYIKPSYTDKVLDMMEIENYNVTIWAKGDYHSPQLFNINTISVGDTNLDGNINIRDVTAIQRHLVELETFNDEQIALADTNGDGEINISDATHLQMFLAEYDGIVLGES